MVNGVNGVNGRSKTGTRCDICNKKLNPAESIMGLCRCKGIYCSIHRQIEDHNCKNTDQIRSEGTERLKKSLVHAVPDKLIRI
jgi:hypothetical protein